MGLIITTESQALAALEILCPSGSDPVLSVDDMTSLLEGAKRAVLWEAATSYEIGTIVMPTVRNGRRYRLIAYDGSGTSSGTTEPTWPAPVSTSDSLPIWATTQSNPVVGWWRNAIVSDGDITWVEDGTDYDSLWDIQSAAFQGWLLKAGRAVCAIDISTENKSFKQSQIYDHCINMSLRYQPVFIS